MARMLPTFPFLVYEEFIASIVMTALLLIWSMTIPSPLEEHANPNLTPNPSKAPWYFLGLQEMLVYFDPWIAGVVVPSLIVVGLMLIPFLDNNPRGVGRWAPKERPFAYTMFLFGFFLWIFFIPIGTYIRGPSWQWYWPWEAFTTHKEPPSGLWDVQPLIGLGLLAAYFGIGMLAPVVFFKKFVKELGPIRFPIVMFLLLMMMSVPIKIVARLLFNIKYFFNGGLTGIDLLSTFRI